MKNLINLIILIKILLTTIACTDGAGIGGDAVDSAIETLVSSSSLHGSWEMEKTMTYGDAAEKGLAEGLSFRLRVIEDRLAQLIANGAAQNIISLLTNEKNKVQALLDYMNDYPEHKFMSYTIEFKGSEMTLSTQCYGIDNQIAASASVHAKVLISSDEIQVLENKEDKVNYELNGMTMDCSASLEKEVLEYDIEGNKLEVYSQLENETYEFVRK